MRLENQLGVSETERTAWHHHDDYFALTLLWDGPESARNLLGNQWLKPADPTSISNLGAARSHRDWECNGEKCPPVGWPDSRRGKRKAAGHQNFINESVRAWTCGRTEATTNLTNSSSMPPATDAVKVPVLDLIQNLATNLLLLFLLLLPLLSKHRRNLTQKTLKNQFYSPIESILSAIEFQLTCVDKETRIRKTNKWMDSIVDGTLSEGWMVTGNNGWDKTELGPNFKWMSLQLRGDFGACRFLAVKVGAENDIIHRGGWYAT